MPVQHSTPRASPASLLLALPVVERALDAEHQRPSIGEWDEVMAVVKRAVDVVAETSPRVGLVLKADIRPGYDGELTGKVERVERTLEG